ncbi:urea ABC transporter permease subunit UrtB [Acuticoccus sp. M5D2P5]|uniref:urea ABC transporter permease subunit UrtB n=1 Tax=Acuticoccus kalidii TaxID=2910977 RepID=UPI001F3838ED|nr:urea ABC transporter permease subunit UrtB [Acuticoccus kalidii]MCF3934723.1 urea ABC transporter permease subunit UrtB [Acuticoccus kalidii]
MLRSLCLALLCLSVPLLGPACAQPAPTPIEEILLQNSDLIEESSRRTIEPAIAALSESGLPEAADVMIMWRDKELWRRKSDGRFFRIEPTDDRDTYLMKSLVTGEEIGPIGRRDVDQIKPNSGIRGLIDGALVQFQLTDPNPSVRRASLDSLARDPSADQLPILRRAIKNEAEPGIKAQMARIERLLTVRFDEDIEARIEAIESFAGDLGVDVRATLNPLLTTVRKAIREDPDTENVAATLTPGTDAFSYDAAYDFLVSQDLAPKTINAAARDAAIVANIENGSVAGIPVATLDTRLARDAAYDKLTENGAVSPALTEAEREDLVDTFNFFDAYREDPQITEAVLGTIGAINTKVRLNEMADLSLDALSLASIYFLAAIGLAITFGVMGVINMAHGEFIMMGAYTAYVVQLFIPDRTLSIIVALPLAFLVTFAAGVILERLVIRWLYHRPLETLLATFGVSIALQQLAKNIFGTQARPLTAPDWLGGQLVFNDVVAISYIRIAIFVLAIVFFVLLLFVLNRTRLGLEVRAVRQNPRMASSMGIDRERVNMLTFGLGSGIAGIAGVAIGLFAKVTSELGQAYIVQSFMTVVVGGVGNVWGTLAGATLIGFLQKGIEWFNPSNTLAAQTYMIVFIIIFIQFRPRGIVALKGRAAEA